MPIREERGLVYMHVYDSVKLYAHLITKMDHNSLILMVECSPTIESWVLFHAIHNPCVMVQSHNHNTWEEKAESGVQGYPWLHSKLFEGSLGYMDFVAPFL